MLPITILESMLSKQDNSDVDHYVEINGSFVTIKELKDFWIEGHKRLEETKKFIAEAKELLREHKSEDETGLQKVKSLEESSDKEKKRPRRTRPNNKKQAVLGS